MEKVKFVRNKRELKKIKHKKIAVFDVECWKHAKEFAFGVVVYTDNLIDVYTEVFYDVETMKNFLLSERLNGFFIYAHNGSRYDYITIFGNYIIDNTDIIMSGSNIIQWKYQNRYFYDSFVLLRSKVSRIGSALGMEKYETPEKFIKGNNSDITDKDIEYCKNDCMIILQALIKIIKEKKELSYTIASLSMNFFRRTLKKSIPVKIDYDREFIKSYRGGRTECFYFGLYENAYMYDVNSMYPYVMAFFTFPNPAKLKKVYLKGVSPGDIIFNYEGTALCRVRVKTDKVGILPYFYKGRLCFPKGIFEGYYNFNELRYPYERGYLDIEFMDYGIISEPYVPEFASFIMENYDKRNEYRNVNNEFMNLFYKYILNSLYGKFGQKDKPMFYYFSTFEKANNYALKNNCSEISKINDCYIVKKNGSEPKHSIYAYSSYVTSQARAVLFRYMDHVGFNNVLYCDTDSIIVTCKIDDMFVSNTDLGKLKYEGNGDFIGVKSKFYRFGSKVKIKGGRVNDIKVITKNLMQIDDFIINTDDLHTAFFVNSYEKMVNPKEVIRNGKVTDKLGYFVNISKKFDINDTKRNVKKLNDFTEIIEIH